MMLSPEFIELPLPVRQESSVYAGISLIPEIPRIISLARLRIQRQ